MATLSPSDGQAEGSGSSQVMSGQVSQTTGQASLLQTGEAELTSVTATTAETRDQTTGLPDNSRMMNRPQALLDAERRLEMAATQVVPPQDSETPAGTGLQRPAAAVSGNEILTRTREALLAQGNNPLDLERSAGEGQPWHACDAVQHGPRLSELPNPWPRQSLG